jgi:hypothetical protein
VAKPLTGSFFLACDLVSFYFFAENFEECYLFEAETHNAISLIGQNKLVCH